MIYVFGIMLAAILALGGVASCEHKKVISLEASIQANKIVAKQIFDAETAKNTALSKQWAEYARKADDDYAKQVADIRARGNSARGVRLYDAGCGQGGASAAAGGKDTGEPQSAATAGQLSDRTTQFLVAQATRADEVHAYAVTCHEYVKSRTIRQTLRDQSSASQPMPNPSIVAK